MHLRLFLDPVLELFDRDHDALADTQRGEIRAGYELVSVAPADTKLPLYISHGIKVAFHLKTSCTSLYFVGLTCTPASWYCYITEGSSAQYITPSRSIDGVKITCKWLIRRVLIYFLREEEESKMKQAQRPEVSAPEAVGRRIKLLRDELGLDQAELGRLIEDRRGGTIGAWERGEKSPNLRAVVRLAEVFDVSTDYLLTGHRISDASVCEKTGLSQRAIDDLEIWNSGRFTSGFMDYVLTKRIRSRHNEQVGFSDLISTVNQAAKARIASVEECLLEADATQPPMPTGAYIGGGETIPYDEIAEGLCAKAGDIFMRLLTEYVWEEAIKHAQKEDGA